MGLGWYTVATRVTSAALLPGHVHPDEFFQAPEVASSAALGVRGTLPWEYVTPYENL